MEPIPDVDIDIYAPEIRANPYEAYRALRDTASLTRLPKYDLYALTRYEDVREALTNWVVFSSAKGVAMNDAMNDAIAGGTLGSDDPIHAKLRAIVGRPLSPPKLSALRQLIASEADALVERLCAHRRFDAATQLAQYLPLTIVSELVGLPDGGREKMLTWAAANFNSLGPRGLDLTETALPILGEMVSYAKGCTQDRVKPGSWVAQLYEAFDKGEIAFEQVGALMNDYLGPSLDTTIFATSNAISLFSENPDQWDRLRRNPSLIPNAINEVVRIESPIQGFTRYVTRDIEINGQLLPAHSRVLVLYASANRDERHWDNPDRFDIERKVSDHVGFGHGVHSCLGANLARLEISCLLSALVKRVSRIDVHTAERVDNLVLRGFKRLDVSVEPRESLH